MQPAVTVLQLDTDFPRVPGDVGCIDTYRVPIEVLRIPHATVANVVSARPDLIDIKPFEDALDRAAGDIIVTSCGFLSYWQDHIAARTPKPFVSSALTALKTLSTRYSPDQILTLTFDACKLTRLHFGAYPDYAKGTLGLTSDMHLRRVISDNLTTLDVGQAQTEITDLVLKAQCPAHKHILLECTNLPPYKSALQQNTGLPVTDILTCIEELRPGTVHTQFLR